MPTSKQYFFLAALITVATSVHGDGPSNSPQKEQELIAVLRSDAPAADKAITCKQLAIYGSSDSVADLAKLLPNAQLSSWARTALEAIPGDAADDALLAASSALDGKLLVGTINSIGVRQIAKATDLLSKRLQDQDAEIASAAAVALGRIGNDDATKSLRAALTSVSADVRSAVAEGCVLCAERLHAAGKAAAAVEIYDEVRNADVPPQRKIEATRGAMLARNDDGIPLLIETFQSPDNKMFQLALGTAREFPGAEVDKALASEVTRTTPERAALMIQAMADRPDTVVLAAVLSAAQQGDKRVRLSAINALQRVGDVSCLPLLLKIAGDYDANLSQTAKVTLAGIAGVKVDSQIVAMLPTADQKTYLMLLQLIGQRRIDAVPEVMKGLDHSDAAVRAAALVALGETVSLQRLSVLISQVVAPKHPEDSSVAQQALKAASIRMPDREAAADALSMALSQAPTATKNLLLEILSDVGGANALKTLAAQAKSIDPDLQDTSSRLLGKWNGVDAAPVLLDLATTAPAEKYRVRALRGYIGLVRKFAMPDQQRAEMCQQAFKLSRRPEDQKLVLDVLRLYPSTETLKLAIDARQFPDLKADATAATLDIAQKLGGKGVDVSALLASTDLEPVKLEIVKAEYGAGATQKDVTETVRKHAGSLPLIALSAESFNIAFGGDPVPGSVKKLRIQYRINDKAGEASFAEDSLIILPIPK